MNKLLSKIRLLTFDKKVCIVGGGMLLFASLITSFLFFIGYAYVPISILSFIPFALLNVFLYTKQINISLEQNLNRTKVTLLFIARYIIILLPLGMCCLLYHFLPDYFNPIVMVISLVIFQFSYKIVAGKLEVEDD